MMTILPPGYVDVPVLRVCGFAGFIEATSKMAVGEDADWVCVGVDCVRLHTTGAATTKSPNTLRNKFLRLRKLARDVCTSAAESFRRLANMFVSFTRN